MKTSESLTTRGLIWNLTEQPTASPDLLRLQEAAIR
jgi:hypothetical protein